MYEYVRHGTGPMSSTGTQAIVSFVSSFAKQAGEMNWPDIQYILLGTAVYTRMVEDFHRAFNVKKEVLTEYYRHAVLKDSFHIFVR